MGQSIITTAEKPPLEIAIVGGGVIGVITALGLLKRGLSVTIYERASQWPDYGAAFAFTAVARECMKRLDPKVLDALMRVGMRDPNPTFQYWDGVGPRTKEAAEDPETGLMFEVPEKDLAFVACLRTQFLLEIAKGLPEAGGVVHFDKQLTDFTDLLEEGQSKVVLSFADGSTAEADVGSSSLYSITVRFAW